MISDYDLIRRRHPELGLPDRDQAIREYELSLANETRQQRAKEDAEKALSELKDRERAHQSEYQKRGFVKFDGGEIGLCVGNRKDLNEPVTELDGSVIELNPRNQLVAYVDSRQRAERLKKLSENNEVVRAKRELKYTEHEIYGKLPHSPAEIRSLCAFAIDPEFSKWVSLAESKRDEIVKRFGLVPSQPQLIPIWENQKGLQPCLKVRYRGGE